LTEARIEGGVNSPVREAETLQTLAEIAIALAGFTGIVAVLGRRVRGEWAPLEWARLRDLLLASLGVVFFAFIPQLLHSVIPEIPTVWRISSGLFALYHLTIMSLFFRRSGIPSELLRAPSSTPSLVAFIFTPPAVCVLLAQFAVAFGFVPSAAYFVYFLALLWLLFIGSLQFVILLLSS
jgi:hypothetical protein